jgi:pre-mRNA-splicing factor SYF1
VSVAVPSSARQDSHDIGYEESILRDPYSLTHWLNYLEFKAGSGGAGALAQRWRIYERAVRVLPGSYKLWMKYIKERVVSVGLAV